MNLFNRVGRMFGFNARERSQADTAHAIERIRAAGNQADELNTILRGYLKTEDPFKAFAVDVFERGQESRIHRGPSRQ
jgi:hypothetical protein